MQGPTRRFKTGSLVCHCLLIEGENGLILVDTGFGLRDVRMPTQRLSKFFLEQCRPQLREEDTALRQIERLGFSATDVRDIVLTHLDFDHAGGLDDFPHARVHLMADEHRAARAQKTALDRRRFRPAQWATEPNWITYSVAGEPWYGFDCVRQLQGVPPEILLVPLVGHTLGHAGIAIRYGAEWLLHCGDAYFYRGEVDPVRPSCSAGLRFYQRMMEKDRRLRLLNQERLRYLRARKGQEVRLFCAHDPVEFEQFLDAPANVVMQQLPPWAHEPMPSHP